MSTETEAPKRLWLQDGCDEPDCAECGSDYVGVTWCVDRLHDNDTEYVRADLFAALQRKNEALREALEEIALIHKSHAPTLGAMCNVACEMGQIALRALSSPSPATEEEPHGRLR